MKLGLYVGSFNPVHKGHLHIINYLLKNNIVDKVEVIATGNYWNKNNLVELDKRIKMLKFYETDKILINEKYNNLKFTCDILKKYKKDEVYLIIGADNLEKLYLWKNFEDIISYNILVMNRNNIDLNYYSKKYKNNKFILVNNFKPINISSSKIRKIIKEKKDEELKKYLDIKVINFIREENLYDN